MTVETTAPVAEDSHRDVVTVFGKAMEYKWVVGIVYVTALFLDIMDTTIVNVAVVPLGEHFHSNKAEWVVLGYTISLAVWIPASGWLGDRLGTKKVFLFALAAFTAGSLLCSLSQSMGQLIAFRVIQGVGGGMLTPVGIAMLYRAFPPSERARAAMFVMVPALVAPALGPVLGGLLVTHVTWHWIFLVNVPIGIVAFFFGLFHLRDHKEGGIGRFDIPGFFLSGAALALIVFALSDGPLAGWTSRVVVLTGTLGLICGIALVLWELHIRLPMLDLRLLANRLFRQCNVVSVLSMASFLGLTFVMPQYLQLLRGQTALTSGLTTFPQAFGIMVSSLVAGRLYAYIGPRRLMTGGLLAAGLTIATFTQIGLDTEPVDDPHPDVPARAVHGLRLRPDAGGDLRHDHPGPDRAGQLGVLHPAPDRRVPRRGHPRQHPHVAHAARRHPRVERPAGGGRPGPDRLPPRLRRRRAVRLHGRVRRMVHQRQGGRGHDAGPAPAACGRQPPAVAATATA